MIKYIWLSFLLKIAVSSILTNVTQLHQLGQLRRTSPLPRSSTLFDCVPSNTFKSQKDQGLSLTSSFRLRLHRCFFTSIVVAGRPGGGSNARRHDVVFFLFKRKTTVTNGLAANEKSALMKPPHRLSTRQIIERIPRFQRIRSSSLSETFVSQSSKMQRDSHCPPCLVSCLFDSIRPCYTALSSTDTPKGRPDERQTGTERMWPLLLILLVCFFTPFVG